MNNGNSSLRCTLRGATRAASTPSTSLCARKSLRCNAPSRTTSSSNAPAASTVLKPSASGSWLSPRQTSQPYQAVLRFKMNHVFKFKDIPVIIKDFDAGMLNGGESFGGSSQWRNDGPGSTLGLRGRPDGRGMSTDFQDCQNGHHLHTLMCFWWQGERPASLVKIYIVDFLSYVVYWLGWHAMSIFGRLGV